MSRVGADALARLQNVLNGLRKLDGLTEKSPGFFYAKRIPMLHFHDSEDGLVADLKRLPPARGFDRIDMATAAAQRGLIAETERRLNQLQRKSGS